jgi:uncharacterized protein (DUF342 family)
VAGFDRKLLMLSLDRIVAEIETLKADLAKAKSEVSVYSNASGLSKEQKIAYEKIRDNYFYIRDRLKQFEEDWKVITGYLKTHGEGEISILKKVYPNTQLEIKNLIREITRPVVSTSYFVQDGELKEL